MKGTNDCALKHIFTQGMETANSLQKLVQGMTESQGKEFVPETIDEEDDDVPGKYSLISC